MTILILGATGWLGSHYMDYFCERGYGPYGCSHNDCDITSLDQVRVVLRHVNPDVVINCAGMTHSPTIPNIDGCIESVAARNQTILTNVVGASNVAEVCDEQHIKLVHIGSGCIFNGYNQVFTEESEPNPPSFYAQTKLDGDRVVLVRASDALVLRVRMLISGTPHPRNLVTKLAKATEVIDATNTVTVMEDLMILTEQCLKHKGIIHAVHLEPLHFRDLMRWYHEIVGPWNGKFIPANQYKTMDGRSNAIVTTKRRDTPSMRRTELAVRTALYRYADQIKATVL